MSTPARTVLALRHVTFEDLGVLDPLLRARGFEVVYRDAPIEGVDAAAVADADLLVVLGGPIGVYDEERYPFLRDESSAIAARLRAGGPALGVCLGAQLIAHALGAAVAPTGSVEIGFGPVALTAEGQESPLRPLDGVPVLHWHGDAFEIPEGADRLAETPGFPRQAFRTTTALGLQFHLEADHRFIESWLVGHAHELHANGVDPRTIREQARAHGPRLEALAASVVGGWLDELEATGALPPMPRSR